VRKSDDAGYIRYQCLEQDGLPGAVRERPNYLSLGKIKKAIRSGQVRGFIGEGFGTVEAVRRENRAKFHTQNVPKVKVTHKSHGSGLNCMTI